MDKENSVNEEQGKVIYLHSWLDCPDNVLRKHYSMQEKITYARRHFFYKLKEEGCSESRARFLYSIWVQNNRNKIKAVKNEFTSDPPDFPDAS